MANYNGSLKAVDCHIHSVIYDMVLECCWRPSQIDLIRPPTMLVEYDMAVKEVLPSTVSDLRWPHQVTYDVVATPIRPTNA
eukprot:scaffold7340_cov134-Skeletonema_marinoi.AAC.1